MSPLAKEIIEKLNKENDIQVLAEVLDFYEYLKHKKHNQLQRVWESMEEEEPTKEEINIYTEYKNSKEELTSLEDLIEELNLDGE